VLLRDIFRFGTATVMTPRFGRGLAYPAGWLVAV
jgi:hypothetical protein